MDYNRDDRYTEMRLKRVMVVVDDKVGCYYESIRTFGGARPFTSTHIVSTKIDPTKIFWPFVNLTSN